MRRTGVMRRQCNDSRLAKPVFRHRQVKEYLLVISRGHKSLIECIGSLIGLLVEEFAADATVLGQMAELFGSGEDLKREVLSLDWPKTRCCGRFFREKMCLLKCRCVDNLTNHNRLLSICENGWLLFTSAGVGDFIGYIPSKCYPELNQALIQNPAGVCHSLFFVEDSLHDDPAGPVLSRAEILSEPLCPVGRLAMFC